MAADDRDSDRTESMGDFGDAPDRPRIERLGHFRIEATLGSGGMGTIYRAYDESMKRPVALKVLHSSLEISERAQSRFVREAWIAGQLDHPNIVKVYSRGEENKVSYLAMELAEGGSLNDFIKQARESIPAGSDVTGTIDREYINDILQKFVELAGALEHIHSKGFIHRDIKPHNILLSDPDKKFKVTDFGIAHADDMTRMTRAGDFIGTVKYMSPELLAAHRAGIDRRTDIYSLGVTLYEALTLTLPFKADSEEKLIGEILAGHYTEARKSNRRIPVDLETVLMKACHHDPDLRYQTAAEFADDLQRIIDGHPILARRPGLLTRGYKYVRRNYKAVLAVAAAMVVVVSAVLWSYYQVEHAHRSVLDQQSTVQTRPDPTFTKISIPTYPGNGVLSPDGEQLAFCSDNAVWTVPLHGKVDPEIAGEPVKLTDQFDAWNYGGINHMAWSGDGKRIAFNGNATDTSHAIYVVSSEGGKPYEIPVELHRGNWIVNYRLSLSPDGSMLAYSSADEPFNEPHTGPPLSPLFIRTVSIDSGHERQITNIPSREPVFSPDGKKIAFIAGSGPRKSTDTTVRLYERPELAVYVVNTSGGQPVLVADLPGWEFDPIWSPDGRMIAFANEFAEGKYEIGIVPVPEDGLGEFDPIIIEPPTQDFKLAGWSTNNQIGICAVGPVHFALYTVPISGGQAVQITPEGRAEHPRWTPDGSRIFFCSGSEEIAWVPADGGKPKVLHHLSVDREPRFYPHYYGPGNDISGDGSTIVISGTKEGVEGTHLWLLSSEGSEPRQLTSSPSTFEDCYPCWSPEGDSVAFIRAKLRDNGATDQCNIYVVSIDGGEPRQVTTDEDSVAWSVIDWSPAGGKIAFRSYEHTQQDTDAMTIKTVSNSGGTPEVVTDVKGAYVTTSLTWSPDGKKIAYDYDFKKIQIISLEDSSITSVETGLGQAKPYSISWSPVGEKIAFAAYRSGELSFFLMDNFLPLTQPIKEETPREPIFSMISVPGLLDYCALSPDGKKIAYVADDSCLWVAPTRGPADSTVAGEAIRLTGPIIKWPLGSLPVWSADGNWIAFNTDDQDSAGTYWSSMYVIPSSGGNLLKLPIKHDRAHWLTFYDYRLSLSPDGKEIAFYSHTSPIPGETQRDCIYAMPVTGAEIRRLVDLPRGDSAYCAHPTYSPDGELIAFLRGNKQCGLANEAADCDIWVVNAGGGTPVQVTDLPGVEFGPVWSPDGRRMAYCHWSGYEGQRGYDIKEILIVKLDDNHQQVDSPTVIKLPLPSDDFIGGWSTNDEIGFVSETELHAAIYTVSSSGGVATMVRPSYSRCPSWSTGGDSMFYVTHEKVCSAPLSGGQESVIPITGLDDLGYEGGCDLSHDGNSLALNAQRAGDTIPHIFTVSAGGGEAKQLTYGSSEDWFPRWSPDDKWIAFSRTVPGVKSACDLAIVSVEGGEVMTLVPWSDSCAYSDGLVDWSPDGKFIAYPSIHHDSVRGISVVSPSDGVTELLVELEPGLLPISLRWSPDGSKIAYTVGSTGYGERSAEVWILPLDSREPRRLQILASDLDGTTRVDWSPDGQKLAFEGVRLSRNTLCLIKDFLLEN